MKRFSLLVLLFSFSLVLFSQQWEDMIPRVMKILSQPWNKTESNKKVFAVSIPEGYIDTVRSECFDDNRVFKSALSCTDAFESKDKEVLVCYFLHSYYRDKDAHYRYDPDSDLRLEVLNGLGWTLRKEHYKVTQEECDKYATYYPQEYARDVYNADTVVTYYFWPSFAPAIYRDKYIGCQAIIGQKNRKGHFRIYCFYTQKGKENLDKYLKELEGFIRFRKDGEAYQKEEHIRLLY